MAYPAHAPAYRPLASLLLAPRELDVLQAFAKGLSSQEVADRLGTDSGAVHESLQIAVRNLGASTRLEAIVVAVRLGLLKLGQKQREADQIRA